MNSIPMFPNKQKITNPIVVIREELPHKDFRFVSVSQIGEFYLVIPETAREVFYIQMLPKNISVFVPREGEGLLIRRQDIDNL